MLRDKLQPTQGHKTQQAMTMLHPCGAWGSLVALHPACPLPLASPQIINEYTFEAHIDREKWARGYLKGRCASVTCVERKCLGWTWGGGGGGVNLRGAGTEREKLSCFCADELHKSVAIPDN